VSKRIVIALGGNALGSNLEEQMKAVKNTAVAIADLIEEGNEIVIAHGNGPQVGMIQNAMTELRRSNPEKYVQSPLSVCVAMSQGYIGYDLQNALREELLDRGIQKDCATMLTQVEVSPDDPAFKNPTKPIGSFMTKEEADELVREKGYISSCSRKITKLDFFVVDSRKDTNTNRIHVYIIIAGHIVNAGLYCLKRLSGSFPNPVNNRIRSCFLIHIEKFRGVDPDRHPDAFEHGLELVRGH